jgi:F-type H+-transporting ATPase subunit b
MMLSRLVTALVVAGALVACWGDGSPALGAASHGAVDTQDDHGSGESGGHGAGGHGGGGIDPLAFQGDLALWTGVVFVILFAILWKFAWGPIREGLDKREQGIADQIAQAEAANQQAKDLLAQYGQRLEGAKDEVREMMVRARQDAEQAGRDMLEKAQAQAEIEHQRALREIDTATASALKELAEQSASLAVDLAGRIVGAKLERADHARLIEQAMGDFARQGPSSN